MTIKTVQDLINFLEDMDPNAEVRFASQPSWPFEYSIADVQEVKEPVEETDTTDLTDEEILEVNAAAEATEAKPPVVYLVEGTQLGYLPGHVADAIGWGN